MKSLTSLGSSELALPPGSYIYQILPLTRQTSPTNFAPLSNGSHLAVLSSNDSVTIIDAATLKPAATLDNVNHSVTCMARFAPLQQDCTTLITTGRDGLVRVWDLRSGKRVSEATATLERLGKQSLSALVANAGTNVIVAGTELYERDGPGDAPIFVWDARQLASPHHMYTESHTDTVTDLRFHPWQENVLLTASTDGLINLINISETDEDEAVLQVANHKSALHHAGFVDQDIFYALGTDETLSFYHVESTEDETPAKQAIALGDLREALDAEYLVNVFPGSNGAAPYVVAGKHSEQRLDLVPIARSGDGWAPNPADKARIEDAHGEEIVRDVYVDQQVVFSCGEDGMVKVWKNGKGDGITDDRTARTEAKKEKRIKGKDGRYAPY